MPSDKRGKKKKKKKKKKSSLSSKKNARANQKLESPQMTTNQTKIEETLILHEVNNSIKFSGSHKQEVENLKSVFPSTYKAYKDKYKKLSPPVPVFTFIKR